MSTKPTSGPIEKALDVVVVDDDLDTREMTRLLFETQGWLVRVFGTIEAARESVARHAPDVLVTDLRLAARQDGLRLARGLRRESGTREVGLILVTGHDAGPEILSDFDHYFRKPVPLRALADAVRALGERCRSERARAV